MTRRVFVSDDFAWGLVLFGFGLAQFGLGAQYDGWLQIAAYGVAAFMLGTGAVICIVTLDRADYHR